MNQSGGQAEQRETEMRNSQPATQILTHRRVEESCAQASPVHEQQTEDPFRSLRSFHEKQRVECQGENPPRTSVSSHSTLEGAVGGVGTNYPKPQRVIKKHHPQGQSKTVIRNQQENNHLQQDSYFQGPHKYCKYSKIYTHSTTAWRTYAVTSSRKKHSREANVRGH